MVGSGSSGVWSGGSRHIEAGGRSFLRSPDTTEAFFYRVIQKKLIVFPNTIDVQLVPADNWSMHHPF
jgi:hypothetical protein